ncbi:PAS domain-containing sensor histidine kinase [Pseudomonas sp. ODNR1LW]|nr:PAS domain-containing sensor histidine kinase [Pseudomonas sp. ODNR1LW]
MNRTRRNAFTELAKASRRPYVFTPLRNGVFLSCLCVSIATVIKIALQGVEHVHYMPLLGAVMLAGLAGSRPAIYLAIVLSVAADLITSTRVSLVDVAVNTLLFVAIASIMGEICHRLVSRTALLHSILTSVPVLTLDDAGHILRITDPAAELLGVEPKNALGRPFDIFAPDFTLEALDATINGEALPAPSAGYWLARRPDGEIVPLILHASLLPPGMDKERVVLSLADQRQALAVNDRMRELMSQLSRSWRLNSLGEMAATLAHELNQPLTAATVYLHAGQADIAKAGPLGDSAGRTLDLAKTQLLRAGDIIRRMRELIATGGLQMTEERVSSMIEDLSPLFDLVRQDAGVLIRLDLDQSGDLVLADRIQFQQAISNLVRNAVDAVCGRDQGIVSVTGRNLPDGGYEIRVEDNGPGIAEDQMDRIFQPMMTTKAGGMGLGLSVTRSIVESHGAVLSVGRSPLGGAEFSFRLSTSSELEAA